MRAIRFHIIFYLKTLLFLSVWIFSSSQPLKANENFSKANEAYTNEDLLMAIEEYEKLVDSGHYATSLFYNLGNAYYQSGVLGKAILNFEKALLLDPKNRNAKNNLKLANDKTKDKIEPIPPTLVDWIYGNISILSYNDWSWMSIVFSFLILVSILLIKFHKTKKNRRISFYALISSILLFLLTFSFAWLVNRHLSQDKYGVIITTQTEVKSAPANNSETVFNIHEGSKVTILNLGDGWSEISVNQGNIGWIENEAFAIIGL